MLYDAFFIEDFRYVHRDPYSKIHEVSGSDFHTCPAAYDLMSIQRQRFDISERYLLIAAP